MDKSTSFTHPPERNQVGFLVEENAKLRAALLMGLEIHDEYMSQIGKCVSKSYSRLNEFPMRCAELGIRLEESGRKSR